MITYQPIIIKNRLIPQENTGKYLGMDLKQNYVGVNTLKKTTRVKNSI